MYKIFIDLDGVLADFERGVTGVTGKTVEELEVRAMWKALAAHPEFYTGLEWTPDGRTLWEYVKDRSPTVLTGLPLGNWAKPQKLEWCRRELGESVPVITCMSRHKARRAREATPEGEIPVLVDDRRSLRESWERIGGIFIPHVSADRSIAQLSALGL